MTGRALGRFVMMAIVAALCLHASMAIAVTAGLRALYPQRIFDVRQWPDNPAEAFRLVGMFLNENARPTGRPVIVFAGSSVTYGYPMDDRVTFAHLFANARPHAKVLNTSIVAADVSAVNDSMICAAKRNAIHVQTVVIEIPVVNALNYLVNVHHAGRQPSPLSQCDSLPADPGYLRFALSTLRGTGWVRFLWGNQPYATGEGHLRIDPVPQGYFAAAHDFEAVRDAFALRITGTLSNAKSVASEVYAFPSPVFVGGLAEVAQDVGAMRQQLQAALAACESVPAVHCIDPSAFYLERSYYSNLTHLNPAGHRAMANLLNTQIAE